MALTEEQEAYLAKFADVGLAEQAEADQRQVWVDKTYGHIEEARLDKLADLQDQAQREIVDSNLQNFTADPSLTQEEQDKAVEDLRTNLESQAQGFVDSKLDEYVAEVLTPMTEEARQKAEQE